MRTPHLAFGLLTLLLAAPASAAPVAAPEAAVARQGYVRARVWVENDRDYFRRGERLAIHFSTSADAYVAVIHIDTDGTLDFLYPQSHWDDNFVRGGRVYSLPRGLQNGWLVRSRPGIGYLYIIASPVPLDLDYFSGRGGWGWDRVSEGRLVRGDPFLAMDQLTRELVPGWPYAPYAADYYSYYVEGRHRYPAYACADRYSTGLRGWGWSSYYGSCDRLDGFLRDHPYYYDTRLYRGDRRTYLRELDRSVPLHGYKEPPERAPARGWQRDDYPPLQEAGSNRARPRNGVGSGREAPPADADRPSTPDRRRPALERRPAEPAGEAPRPAVGRRPAPTEGEPAAAPRPARGVVREPAAQPAPRPGAETPRPRRRPDGEG